MFSIPNAVALTHEEGVRWSMEKNRRRVAAVGTMIGMALAVILPEIIDLLLERWPKMFEWVDTGTLGAIVVVVVFASLGGALGLLTTRWVFRNLDRFEALADEINEVERKIGEALDRGDQMVSCGSAHRLRAKLEKLDISTPRLPPPRVPMPLHKAQEWYDVLVRLRPLAEMRDIRGAKKAWRDAEFEWHWFTQALAEKVANEKDAGKQADILESMAAELRKTGEEDPQP